MDVGTLITETIEQLKQTTLLEAIAVLFGMASVLLANRNHVALYPTGIISTAIYIYIMSKPAVGLYAEAMLNVYYLVMSIYGWVLWMRHKESENPAAITHNNSRDWLITAAIVVIGWAILYTVLSKFTTSDVPVWDALVSATAWAGMWLLAKHKVENWVLLNISNLIAIPLQIHKGIPFTAILTIFLFIVAVSGYFRWKKMYQLQHEKTVTA
ncbi:MAG: nicotinamide riboside transporter PnuC [Sphingobacteriales bacterium]|nr:MAG: nicotinamide riboside transporter PnuC [Sphingobacteriales bacterium]